MIAQVRKLTVKYNGRIVGYLAHLDDDSIAFQYDDEWIKNGFSISHKGSKFACFLFNVC